MLAPGPVDGQLEGPPRAREIDLGVSVDRGSGVALPDQLEAAIRGMVVRGELRAGARLPSTRGLARALAVSRGVVVEAYDRLQRQGVLEIRQGAPVRVAAGLAPADPAPAPPSPEPSYVARLHPALVPPATFDRRAWRSALRRVLEQAADDDLRATDHRGLLELRAAIIEQVARSRGVSAAAGSVTVTSGVSHGLTILAPLLAARGPVAVEEPGFLLHRGLLAALGCDVRPVRVDGDGLDLAALHRSGARTVLLTPAHQMPLGQPMPAEQRTALLAWAREADGLVLEDDYDGELRYDRRSVRALQALDPARVVYLGTTSKVLSPAVRIGWIVAPPDLLPSIALAATAIGGTPGTVDQAALAVILQRGDFDRSVARLRRRCRVQRAALVAALAERAPELTVHGVEAGLMVAVRAVALDPAAVMHAAQARRVQLHAVPDGQDALLLVGFGDVHESRADAVATLLAQIVADARAGAP